MSWRTHPLVLGLRNLGRTLRINTLVASFQRLAGYEAGFQSAMLNAVREGDCVWDVGANVGFYTTQFAQRAGSGGKVIAFEPSPLNRERLNQAVATHANVTVVAAALGDREDVVMLQQGEDSLGATSRVVPGTAPTSGTSSPVRIARGDDLADSGNLPAPDVVKIDTEGYELDVLRGMERLLGASNLSTLCIEVHFDLLKQRGMEDAPQEIERMLSKAGFSCRWPDWSHLVAERPRP